MMERAGDKHQDSALTWLHAAGLSRQDGHFTSLSLSLLPPHTSLAHMRLRAGSSLSVPGRGLLLDIPTFPFWRGPFLLLWQPGPQRPAPYDVVLSIHLTSFFPVLHSLSSFF